MPVLTNQDIWLAYPNLMELLKRKWPVDVSVAIAISVTKIIAQLEEAYWAVDRERSKLVIKYGVRVGEKVTVPPDAENAGDFALVFSEFLMREVGNIPIEKIKLPRKVTSKCDKCGQDMEILFQIEPNLLVPLAEHFVEVV